MVGGGIQMDKASDLDEEDLPEWVQDILYYHNYLLSDLDEIEWTEDTLTVKMAFLEFDMKGLPARLQERVFQKGRYAVCETHLPRRVQTRK